MFALLPLRYVTIQVDASWRQDVAAVFASDFSSAWPRSVVELNPSSSPRFSWLGVGFLCDSDVPSRRRSPGTRHVGQTVRRAGSVCMATLQQRAFAHGGGLLYEVGLERRCVS